MSYDKHHSTYQKERFYRNKPSEHAVPKTAVEMRSRLLWLLAISLLLLAILVILFGALHIQQQYLEKHHSYQIEQLVISKMFIKPIFVLLVGSAIAMIPYNKKDYITRWLPTTLVSGLVMYGFDLLLIFRALILGV